MAGQSLEKPQVEVLRDVVVKAGLYGIESVVVRRGEVHPSGDAPLWQSPL